MNKVPIIFIIVKFVLFCSSTTFAQLTFSDHTIAEGTDGAQAVHAIDVDGDGDTDVLSASGLDNIIAWYENDGNQNFTKHVISSNAQRARSVFAIDIDGDGDIDAVSASILDSKIAWYENDGNENFTEHVIPSTLDSPRRIYAIDLDSDNDIDVLSASAGDSRITWFENDNQNFTEHIITSNANSARGVFAIDVDSDGDNDVLSSSVNDDKIAWYENDGNENFTEHTITTNADGCFSVYAIDVDGDGDIDALSASGIDDKIAWYENDGNENFTEHVITTSANSARKVFAIDLDQDGDTDVLSASQQDNTVAWYENDGNANFTEHAVSTNAGGPRSVFAIDVDGDNDLDVVSASFREDRVNWHENLSGNVGSPPVVSGIPDETIDQGSAFTDINLDDFVTDPDHADSDMSWTTSGNAELTISIDANRVAAINYPADWTGSETITFTATDPDNLSDSDAATFTVIGPEAPEVSDITDQSIDEGDVFATIALDDFVDDPDTDDADITWAASGNTDLTISIDANRIATITYPVDWTGSETITFTATDPDNLSDSDAATFTVNAAGGPEAPVISDILDQSIDEGDQFTNINLDDFVTDPDNADSEITWTVSGGSNISVTIDANRVASISYTEGWTGSETITFTATDPDNLNDSDDAIFTVNEAGSGNAPVVSDIPDQSRSGSGAFETIFLDDFVDDPDHADNELTWSASGQSQLSVHILNTGVRRARVLAPSGFTGSETITFTATDPDGNSDSDDVTFTVTEAETAAAEKHSASESDSEVEIPGEMALQQNYPNPFNPDTRISYSISESSWVRLKIYNVFGQEIVTLVDGFQSAGFKSVVWNGKNRFGETVSSGIYLYKITADDFTEVRKMSLMR